MDKLVEKLQVHGQEQLVKYYDELSEDLQKQLEQDIQSVDWDDLSTIYKEQVKGQTENGKVKPASKIDDTLLEELPAENIGGTTRCDAETLEKYRTLGLTEISNGGVAALLLAGGQGTRLGVNYPKGMYDVGLPTHKSLFQLQAERIKELSEHRTQSTGQKPGLFWYVMTSGPTMKMTKAFFESNNYFGLSEDKVVFFEQNTIPCFDFDGKVLLDEKHAIARSPNGNGGLYEVLHEKGILDHMVANGIKYVHVYCVDNILIRVCDPTFVGYCISKQAEAGAKVVEKVNPNEAVGTICKVKNQFKVIEYSEISDEIANKRDSSTGKLTFNAGNICEHFFSLEFLKKITGDKKLRYHLAMKKIPHISIDTGIRVQPTQPNGIKLEKFIFDVFEYTNKFVAWEVKREDEFSPIKNAVGTEKDNPTTALRSLLRSYELGLLKV